MRRGGGVGVVVVVVCVLPMSAEGAAAARPERQMGRGLRVHVDRMAQGRALAERESDREPDRVENNKPGGYCCVVQVERFVIVLE